VQKLLAAGATVHSVDNGLAIPAIILALDRLKARLVTVKGELVSDRYRGAHDRG
jgi:hypothetical protein